MQTTNRSVAEIEKDIKAAAAIRARHISLQNEGADGYVDDSRMEALAAELTAAQQAVSPLTTNLAAEKAWFNAQGFTGADLAKANKACLARGYSLADLQAACKR